MSRQKLVDLLSVPSDLGANVEGSSRGPLVLKKALMSHEGLQKKINFFDKAEIKVPPRNRKNSSPKFEKEILSVCKELRDQVYNTLEENRFPLVLGGDHSLAVGSIFGASRYCIEQGLSLGIIWIDAHADMNTPTSSQTGNIHGMPLATVLGHGHNSLLELAQGYTFVDPQNVSLVGVRSIDRKEQVILDQSQISYYRMDKIREKGALAIGKEIKKNLIDKVDCLHLSFDLDVMDPSLVPSVSTPEAEGMIWDEAQTFLESISSSNKLLSMDIVEYNPDFEKENKGVEIAERVLDSVFSKKNNFSFAEKKVQKPQK